jgi:hypothetical protein
MLTILQHAVCVPETISYNSSFVTGTYAHPPAGARNHHMPHHLHAVLQGLPAGAMGRIGRQETHQPYLAKLAAETSRLPD